MTAPQVAALIQARMSSSRLPGKSLREICGKPMLQHVVERARAAKTLGAVWVVTSTDSTDDRLAEWCRESGVSCSRGPLTDVLARYEAAATAIGPEIVVRLSGDCPLTDPKVIDQVVSALKASPTAVYAASRMPDERTFPLGIDVEAVRRTALGQAAQESTEPYQREHVTPYFYDGSIAEPPLHIRAEIDAGQERWTVDTAEDLDLVREILKRLPPGDYAWQTVHRIVQAEPALRLLNAMVQQRHYRETS